MHIQARQPITIPHGDWAPDAVLAPPPGYQACEPSDTVSFFGVELPSATLLPRPEHCPAPAQEPSVWAPDAVLAPSPGSNSQPTEEKGTVTFFGAEIPAYLLHGPLY